MILVTAPHILLNYSLMADSLLGISDNLPTTKTKPKLLLTMVFSIFDKNIFVNQFSYESIVLFFFGMTDRVYCSIRHIAESVTLHWRYPSS